MLGVAEVAAVMHGVVDWWAFAGGWAIDEWLGRQTRDHHDVEVVIRRSDQATVAAALADEWDLWCLDPPGSGWSRWDGHVLTAPAFQLQARSSKGEFDLFTESVDDGVWSYRRDTRVQRAASDVVAMAPSGVPVVRPEVQLVYMASSAEPKNQHDFEVTLPSLGPVERCWLAAALDVASPGHRWLRAL